MSKTTWTILIAVIFVITVVLGLRIISGEDDWICVGGQWTKHGNPSASMPISGCGQTVVPTSTPAISNAEFFRNLNIVPNQVVTSPLKITGEVRGNWMFEANLPIVIVNWDGLITAEGHGTAKSDWMTTDFVPFEATIEFIKPDYGKNGALIFRKDNPSGLPQNDAAYELPISFE